MQKKKKVKPWLIDSIHLFQSEIIPSFWEEENDPGRKEEPRSRANKAKQAKVHGGAAVSLSLFHLSFPMQTHPNMFLKSNQRLGVNNLPVLKMTDLGRLCKGY